MNFKFLALILTVFFITDCGGGFSNRKLAYRTTGFALYKLNRKNYEYKKLIPDSINHPYDKLDEKSIRKALAKVRYSKKSTIGSFEDVVFTAEDLNELTEALVTILSNAKKDELAIGIVLSNESNSVLPSFSRTSFMIWVDSKNRLNLVFGEIDSYIPYEQTTSFIDWSNIPLIRLTNVVDSSNIIPDSVYSFHQNEGFPVKRWLVYDLNSSVFKLKPLTPPIKEATAEKKDTVPPKSDVIIHKEK